MISVFSIIASAMMFALYIERVKKLDDEGHRVSSMPDYVLAALCVALLWVFSFVLSWALGVP